MLNMRLHSFAEIDKPVPTVQIGKLLGAEWRECSAKDKKKFEAMGAKDKIRAAKDKAAWEKTQ